MCSGALTPGAFCLFAEDGETFASIARQRRPRQSFVPLESLWRSKGESEAIGDALFVSA